MTQKNIIALLTSESRASWIISNDTGYILKTVIDQELINLPILKNCDVYIFVPSSEVILTKAMLPKLSRQRLLQALPFALEEQLIDDVTDLHFAIGKYQEDGSLPVAIVAQEKLNRWLNLFEPLEISPRALIPSIFMLPFNGQSWQVNCHQDHCIVRTGKWSGFVCEKSNLDVLLDLKLAEEPNGLNTPLIHTHFSDQELLEKVAANIKTFPYINLLQRSFQPKPKSTQTKKIWLAASFLALTILGVLFFNNVTSYFILHHRNNRVENEIRQIYFRNFPQASSLVAPRERMTSKLQATMGESNKDKLLVILSVLGKTLTETPGIKILNMDYREQQMTLDITAATFDVMDAFTQGLKKHGLNVKAENAATSGNQVKGTLFIKVSAA